MALSSSQLAKRREKKNLARKEKAKEASKVSQLDNIHEWPLVTAYAPFEACEEETMVGALIVRRNALGKYAVGVFLIDMWSLGVKDAFIKVLPSYLLSSFIDGIRDNMQIDEVPPSYVATLIHEAIQYAKSLGIDPHKDYSSVKKILTGIPLDDSYKFTFGRDGKPYYMAGPNDTPEFALKVIEKMSKTVGEENYDYVIPIEGMDGDYEDDDSIEGEFEEILESKKIASGF